eukprot:gene22171-3902_t
MYINEVPFDGLGGIEMHVMTGWQHVGRALAQAILLYALWMLAWGGWSCGPAAASSVGAAAAAAAAAGGGGGEPSASTLVLLALGMLGNVGDLAGASAGYGSSSSAQATLSTSFERLPSSLSPAALSRTASMGITSAKLNNDGEGDTVNVLDCYGKKHFVNGNPVIAEGAYKNDQQYLESNANGLRKPSQLQVVSRKGVLVVVGWRGC